MAMSWTQTGLSDAELEAQNTRVGKARAIREFVEEATIEAGAYAALEPEEAFALYPDHSNTLGQPVNVDDYRAGTWFYYTEGLVTVRQDNTFIRREAR